MRSCNTEKSAFIGDWGAVQDCVNGEKRVGEGGGTVGGDSV